MARSSAWLWLSLGAAFGVAAACSGASTKRATGDVAGAGGAAEAGAASNAAGAAAGTAAGAGGTTDEPGSAGASEASGASGASAAGAGGDAATTLTDGWLSGTRLRAVLDVSGSAKLFKTWHDAMLDVDCAFGIDAHNVERCLPTSDNGSVYADDKCTKAIVVLAPGQAIPPYVPGPWEPFECGHGFSYFTVGADTTASKTYSHSSGSCQENGTIEATQIVKALGPAVPETTFVAATETLQEPRDARLLANVRVAADGSRQVTSHFDRERQADCNPRQHQGDGYACIPEDRAYVEVFFSDKACKVPAAYHPAYAQQVCGHAPAIIQNSMPDFTDGYFEVGAQVTGGVYNYNGATCDPFVSPGDPDATYFSVGKEAPWSGFPPLSSQHEGAGRIAINVLRGPGDELVSREEFFDTMLGTVCAIGKAADSKLRCLPRNAWSVNQFADSKCSDALFVNGAADPLPPGLTFLQSNGTDGSTIIYKIGTKISAPAQTWQLNGLDCQQAGAPGNQDYYSTTLLPATELASATTEVE